MVDVACIAMAREVLCVIKAPQSQHAGCTVDLGARRFQIGGRLVDMQQAGELRWILALRKGVVVVHHPVAAARLQHAVVDPGIRHLREQELGRADDVLHADRLVLDVVILAFVREAKRAEAAHTKVHVREPGPRVVSGPEQHRRLDLLAVARAERTRRRSCHHLLQILEMDGGRRMTARTFPFLEHVRVAIDDHRRVTFR